MKYAARIVPVAALLSYASASAANFAFAETVAVPTLDEIGLSALIAGIGAVAGWYVRSRGKKK